MAKILINNTASPVTIADVGQTVPASSQLSIAPQDYLLYAASSNVITLISDLSVGPTTSTLTVNDGSDNLNISDGVDLIKGLFPAYKISNPAINNITVAAANVEQSFSLPSGTLEFRLKARNKSKIQLSYTSGQSNTNYITITPGCEYERTRINPTTSITLYFQVSKDNTELELETFI
jgi:hypothetical protein